MRWQLESFVRADRYNDYFFPFEQFGGVNVGLVSLLTVSHPIATEADAENYVARLGQVAPRLDEAIAEARRLAELGFVPPRFILRATLAQMQQFVATPPAQNPFVASFASRMAAAPGIPEARRPAFAAEAERMVALRCLSGLEAGDRRAAAARGEGDRRCRLVAVQGRRGRLR